MNRLTEKNESGNWNLKGLPWEILRAGATITEESRKILYGALFKLKNYEDTGLSPEDIERVNNFEKSQAGKLLKKLNEEQKKHQWIPAEEELPSDDRFVLLSFANSHQPMIGRYEQQEDGSGNWYIGDCDEGDTCLANDLFVNAWLELPKAYREGEK